MSRINLMATIAISVAPSIRSRIERIDQEDFESMVWKVREELESRGITVTDEYIERCVLALKQYYVVALLDPLNFHAVSDVLDPFWHAHILHTKMYVQFCQDIFGQYMHHAPLDHTDQADVDDIRRLYEYTGEIYEKMFVYYDRDLFPKTLSDPRLCCCHGRGAENNEVSKRALFPYNAAMQLG